jgi:hypothetical protein
VNQMSLHRIHKALTSDELPRQSCVYRLGDLLDAVKMAAAVASTNRACFVIGEPTDQMMRMSPMLAFDTPCEPGHEAKQRHELTKSLQQRQQPRNSYHSAKGRFASEDRSSEEANDDVPRGPVRDRSFVKSMYGFKHPSGRRHTEQRGSGLRQ